MDLCLHEKRILNAVSLMKYPMNCFFLPEPDFKFAFHEPWHQLNTTECLAALAKLVAAESLMVYTAVPTRSTLPQVYVGLTDEGARLWENAYRVRWEHLIEFDCLEASAFGAEEVDESNRRISIQATDKSRLEELLQEIRTCLGEKNIAVLEIVDMGEWEWSYVKTLGGSYALLIELPRRLWDWNRDPYKLIWSLTEAMCSGFKLADDEMVSSP